MIEQKISSTSPVIEVQVYADSPPLETFLHRHQKKAPPGYILPAAKGRPTPGPSGVGLPALKNDPCVGLHRFFEARVRETPDALAVEFVEADQRLTYAELNARANQLASALQAQGIGTNQSDQIVGIYLTRGIDWYIAILGILKAGAAYLPIDTEFPIERVQYILEDADASMVLTYRDLAHRCTGNGRANGDDTGQKDKATRPFLAMDEMVWQSPPAQPQTWDDVSINAASLAYVIYTSGTTGHPKGVCLSHGNAATFVNAMKKVYQIAPTDRVLQGFSTSFDASVEEIWMALATGAALVVGSLETMRVVDELPQKLRDLDITVFSTVPTLLAVLEPDDLPRLRLLIMGGEATRADIIKRWHTPQRRLLNTYGPTECTVVATYAECQPGVPVTIGKPMPGYGIAILNDALEPVAEGEEGELCVSGPAVSEAGYLRRPELNRCQFIQLDGKRFYRTGDLVARNPAGDLLFCGRIDAQVKIRGYRVELEEIETLLTQFVATQEPEQQSYEGAIVGVHQEKCGLQLVAYLLQKEPASVDLSALLVSLREQLPTYMVPSHYVSLHPDHVPCLTSGKIDRKRLPLLADCVRLMASSGCEDTPDIEALCESALERTLLPIWRGVLQAPELTPTDSFFDYGGNSVTAAEAISLCRKDPILDALGIRDIYQCPTVRTLGQRLEARLAQQRQKQAERAAQATTAAVPGLAPGIAPAPYKAPRRQYLLVSAAQTAVIVGGFFAGTYAALAFLYLLFTGWQALSAATSQVMAGVIIYAGLALLGPPLFLAITLGMGLFWKWLLVGKFREMDIPLWSWGYFRWWISQSFLAPIRGLAGAFLGTPLANVCYRVLGAKIGKDVYLGVPLQEADLVTIEEGATISQGTVLNTHSIESGMLKLRAIHIGKYAYTGNQSTVSGGVKMGEGSILHPLSCLTEGTITPAGSEWQGSPAESIPPHQTALAKLLQQHAKDAQPSDGWSTWQSGLRIYLMQSVMSTFAGMMMLPSFLLYILMLVGLEVAFGAVLSLNLAILLPATLLFSALRFVSSMATLIATKWLLTGRATPGTIRLNSFEYVRRWLCASLMSTLTSPMGLRPFVETLLAPYICRWLGMGIGKNVEISDLTGGQPDLVKLNDNVMLADGCYLANPVYYRGRMSMGMVEIDEYTFVGNGAAVPMTTPKVGAHCLLGVLTVTPDGEVPDRTDWLGSPPMQLPQRTRSDAPAERTFKPTRSMYIARGFANFWKIVLPGATFDAFFWISLKIAVLGYFALSLPLFLAMLPLLFLGVSITMFMVPVLLKWTLIGRFQSGERYLWSSWMWRMETLYEIELAMTSSFGSLINGTPWIVQWYRALGAKLGRQVFMNDGFLMEADLIQIDDHVTLSGTGLQTHLFEDRVMKLGPIHIAEGASIGNACVLYNTHIGENAVLGDVSLVMKNETLSPHRQYQGLPAENVT